MFSVILVSRVDKCWKNLTPEEKVGIFSSKAVILYHNKVMGKEGGGESWEKRSYRMRNCADNE